MSKKIQSLDKLLEVLMPVEQEYEFHIKLREMAGIPSWGSGPQDGWIKIGLAEFHRKESRYIIDRELLPRVNALARESLTTMMEDDAKARAIKSVEERFRLRHPVIQKVFDIRYSIYMSMPELERLSLDTVYTEVAT